MSKNLLFTRFHVLEYLRKNGTSRQNRIAEELERDSRKIYKNLKKLMSKGFVRRKKKLYRGRNVYFYSLTPYAENWRIKNSMRSYLSKNNPLYPKLKRVAEQFPKRMKINGEIRVVQKKKLNFR